MYLILLSSTDFLLKNALPDLNPCAESPDSLAAGMNAHEERGSGKT